MQSEYSLWTRNPEIMLNDECRRLGVALVAFSPLARGFLGSSVADTAALAPKDIRRDMPRFQEPNYHANSLLLVPFCAMARELSCTPAQLAISWVLHQGPHVVPIPGTSSLAHLEENIGAHEVRLDAPALLRLEALINRHTVSGARYSEAVQAEIDTEEFGA